VLSLHRTERALRSTAAIVAVVFAAVPATRAAEPDRGGVVFLPTSENTVGAFLVAGPLEAPAPEVEAGAAFREGDAVRGGVWRLVLSRPRESGVRFYKEVKNDEDLKNVPIIIVTALTGWGYDPEGFHKFIKSRKQVPPPEGFMSKPVDTAELLKLVKQHLS
jgi:hypothetical protein